ncbi:MAG: transposase [Eubacterium sp.]|jgi:transposase|nr:transposase [Eubacterium sp.]
MLNDATCFKAVCIVCGCTGLRAGMDQLAALVEAQTGNRPYIKDTLYLFCGRRTDRIKGLL